MKIQYSNYVISQPDRPACLVLFEKAQSARASNLVAYKSLGEVKVNRLLNSLGGVVRIWQR